MIVSDLSVSNASEVLPKATKSSLATPETKFRQHIALECDAMARYALGNGLKLPPSLQQSLDMFENVVEQNDLSVPVATLTSLHGQLADVVAPATPRTIYLLHIDQSRNSWASILGPLSSIRRLVLGAAFFTMVFVLSSLSDSISHQNLSMDIYSLDGLQSLQVLVFLMSAAAMGGCFHALFIAHSYIEQGTYDPRFESSYWMRIGLGIIAGLVLSQMIPIGPGPETGDAATAPASSASVFGKPLLSLLGGFSATLVYTILQRLVETVESLFSQRQAAPQPSRRTVLRQESRSFPHPMPVCRRPRPPCPRPRFPSGPIPPPPPQPPVRSPPRRPRSPLSRPPRPRSQPPPPRHSIPAPSAPRHPRKRRSIRRRNPPRQPPRRSRPIRRQADRWMFRRSCKTPPRSNRPDRQRRISAAR
jgi:hypothetical protein